jgi:hypothetical protein
MVRVHYFLIHGLFNIAASNAEDAASDTKIMENKRLEKSRNEAAVTQFAVLF